MADANPSILSHVSLGSNRFEEALAFYDQVLTTLGCRRILAHPGAVAYGRDYPEFWLQTPIDGQPASIGNGTHVGFFAPDKAAVDAFHRAALAAGGRDEGAPGPRAEYGAPYYGCFVRDLDGHKIEATFWDTAQEYELYSEPAETLDGAPA
ncbi:VOC family protein [Pseudomonas lalucatii]|uniref:VOC family protein n=1 Tax=Pseudomonas lalucatii TaxID=1424203 RepID=A0ABS5Q5J2_9PSED|nr:VOC family protein [Pseudomonas lalucatii]MBS7664035.1 VOC family protein [Pseudomonas lalucatii]MBS7690827.1 VOC family protein [Pseudomonas lalucatii]MBS7725386.1 VOC family protein [Pseudomonas lalucatii]